MATQTKPGTDSSSSEKLEKLKALLEEMSSTIVAYSGGTDSAFLSATANDVLGQKALVVTAESPSLAPSELRDAVSLAKRLGLNHRVIETAEVQRDDYKANDANRCYFCKDELYTKLGQLAKAEGFTWIANGANVDDQGDYRPGMSAATDYGVRSPLMEAELTKAEIRELSKAAGLPTWDKPAQACLSSRIPYGTPVSVEALTQVARAEEFLRSLGFNQLRVRHHDSVARIELEPEEFPKLIDETIRTKVVEHFRSIGYSFITLDLSGFRSGSLNALLTSLRANT